MWLEPSQETANPYAQTGRYRSCRCIPSCWRMNAPHRGAAGHAENYDVDCAEQK